MKNIIKSILYEMWHSKLFFRLYILMIIVMALVGVLNLDGGPVSLALAENPGISYEFGIFIAALVCGIICGEDYRDKVANYEVLSGHSRESIFFARSLLASLSAAVLSTLLAFIPMIAGLVAGGWGDKVEFSSMILRLLLLFFPYLRLATFFALVTFIVKNHYIMMAVGFATMMITTILSEMMKDSGNFSMSVFNMKYLLTFDSWNVYNLDPKVGIVEYQSFSSAMPSGLIGGTIVVSLIFAVIYLLVGYALFRRDELN